MKKRAVEKNPEPPFVPATRSPSRSKKLCDAIEKVFRLTHGREMTARERRLLGFSEDGNTQKISLREKHHVTDSGKHGG